MDLLVLLTFVVSFTAGFTSGFSGGGGGFIMIPYFIWIGLTPQQALATAKMSGIGVAAGALTAFRGTGLVDKRYIMPFAIITAVSATLSAWLIPKVDGDFFQVAIGVILIVLAPTMFINKPAFQPGDRSRAWILLGFGVFVAITFLQTMFGSGLGTLINLVLMFLFGMTALQAQATRRVAQAVQAVILFVLLLVQGLVLVWHGIAGFAGAIIGGHLGGKFAVTRGNTFVKVALAAMMFASGLALLLMPGTS